MKNAIVCENVWKIYNQGRPSETQALSGVSIRVKDGDFVSIMGASGSGKSTLLNCIGSLDKTTKGKVIINGTDTNKMSEDGLAIWRRRNIGFVFQFHFLLPEFTALENVIIPARKLGKYSYDQIRTNAMDMLKMMDMVAVLIIIGIRRLIGL